MYAQIKDVRTWSSVLGLLPVPILPGDETGRFVLLNGTTGNFCLDLSATEIREGKRDAAWSSNVGHYVSLIRERVEVLRYDASTATAEVYSLESVLGRLTEFHRYLEKTQPRSEMSVVAHAIRVFRQLRSAITVDDGRNSLLAFLALLACGTDNAELGSLDLALWGLPEESQSFANEVKSEDWNSLLRDLLEGRRLDSLVLLPNLLLRHASGQLFQEAHYEAAFVNQLRLPGFFPTPAKISKLSRGIGIHFTPPALARTLVEQALRIADLNPTEIRIFDPACGSAEFLREALRQIRMSGYTGTVELIGWDISEPACDMARFLLAWERRSDRYPVKVNIQLTDSLSKPEWPIADVLLMNPPFVSYEELDAEQRTAVTRVLGSLARGRFDMSTSFVWKAFTSQPKGTVIATVIPASFLQADSAVGVRAELSGVMGIHMVARLGSQMLFSNAMVDAATLIGRVGDQTDQDVLAFWADHRMSSTSAGLRELRRATQHETRTAIVGDGFSIYRIPHLTSHYESWAPSSYRAWSFMARLQHLPTVKDLFHVRTGSRPGYLPAFLLDKADWAALPPTEKVFFRPAVVNESIVFGRLYDSKYVFYPYGRHTINDERELQGKVPTYYQDVLLKYKAQLQKRTSKRDPHRWWEMSESRKWQHEPEAKLVSVYFGDRGSFAYDDSGQFVVVQGFAWLPKSVLKAKDAFHQRLAFAYLAVLNSMVMSELLSATSNTVQGGQWDLSARYVERIPMPNIATLLDPHLLSELSELGSGIHRGDTVDDRAVEEAVYASYGINEQAECLSPQE
jgi:adenine-specific DNA-methyltransferase